LYDDDLPITDKYVTGQILNRRQADKTIVEDRAML